MYLERSDDINKEIYNFKAIHGVEGVSRVHVTGFEYVPNVSKDIKVVMITNAPFMNPYNRLYFDNPDKIDLEYIILDTPKFRCGIDLIAPLLTYIKTIDHKYVMYMDTRDTAIMTDIENPQEILDTYKCKLLFNAEDNYHFPDHHCLDKSYLDKYAAYHNCDPGEYYAKRSDVIHINTTNLHSKINCAPYTRSLNSGLFLGERLYLIDVLQEMLDLMNSDPTKGFPYGEPDNQKLWQYIQAHCKNGEIEIDYLNLYFLWTHHYKFDIPVNDQEHFNYNNKLWQI